MPPAMARPKGGVNIERATHIDKDGWYINGANVAAVFHSGTGEIRMRGKDIDRLAAYEDTGLEPEDIKRAFNEAAVLKLAGQSLGITPDRLRELAQADKERRCIILPDPQKTPVLRKGTPVWYVDNETGEIEPGKVFIASYKDGELDSFSVDFECGDFDEFVGSALGNCFFGSKEQAEAALRREKE